MKIVLAGTPYDSGDALPVADLAVARAVASGTLLAGKDARLVARDIFTLILI